MDAFGYLAVLFSIVLGLALQQLLEGLRALLLVRGGVHFYAPPLIWTVILVLVVAQTWWAMFGLRTHTDWSFGMYAIVLLQTGFIYMATSLILPDRGETGAIDMRATYHAHARPFFLTMFGAGVVSIAKDLVIDGHWPQPSNLLFHAVFMGGAAISAFDRRPGFHIANAIVALLAFLAYVALLFSRL